MSTDSDPSPLLILLGPTASGKGSAAVHAAEALDAELIVCDSVKIYRGLGIVAAAPDPGQLARVPHHLVGCLEPAERLHAARWIALADTAIRDVRSRGRAPLVVAGTPLYLKALLYGLFEGPAADAELRERLSQLERDEPGALHRRLAEVDQAAAARIHANDHKRLLRALEVYAATGLPISDAQGQWNRPARMSFRAVGILRSREDLRARIVSRIDRMVGAGLVDEVAALSAGGDLGPTAREAIGVKEVLPLLASAEPETSLAAAVEQMTAHTWQLARRQMTWFKRFEGVTWLDVAADEPAEVVGARVAAALTAAPGPDFATVP